MNQQPFTSADTLLQHEPFVRAVVRGLIFDEDKVQDVVQETWLTALSRPPRGAGSLRSWLARVASNLARDSHRSGARRADREAVVAQAEKVESVESTQKKLSAQREVVDVVLALNEPYKSVVLLRYYQDLSTPEIAERLDRSAATVRSQLSRAHEILRDAMDAKFDGERAVWSALFLPMLPTSAPAPIVAQPPVSLALKLSSAVVGVAAIAIVVVQITSSSNELNGVVPVEPETQISLLDTPIGSSPVSNRIPSESKRIPVAIGGANVESAQPESTADKASAPIERDIWYALMEGETRYGAHRMEVSELPDGNFHYRSSVKYLVDFLASKNEITMVGEYVVTPDLRPVSMRVEYGKFLGMSVVEGQMDEDNFTLSFELPGGESEHSEVISPTETILFSACLEDWLAQIDPSVNQASARIFDDQTWELGPLVATRLSGNASGEEWKIEYIPTATQHILQFNADGILESGQLEIEGHNIELCSVEEANDLTALSLDSEQVLVFPLNHSIEAPHRLKRLVVKLSWKDIAYDEFRLEDARQRVVQFDETSEGASAVVEIVEPPNFVDTATIPVKEPSVQQYLAETDYIKPADPKILSAAKEAIGDTTNAYDAAELLCDWVYEYLDAEMILPTLSGPEVLQSGTGKCTEYATLFGSLARAVGIPTRLALGERMVGGSWMGHMWNEVWVGRWVPIDASSNEVEGSMLLLKFIDSPTVEGTQPLRWALTESLSISIEEFELKESGLSGAFETGINGVTYTNPDSLARISAPSDSWKLKDKSANGVNLIGFVPPDSEYLGIHFMSFPVGKGFDPSKYIDSRIEQAKTAMENFDLISHEPREVYGIVGHSSHFQGQVAGHDQKVLGSDVFWVRGETGFLLTMSGRDTQFKTWLPDFENLIASFHFLDE